MEHLAVADSFLVRRTQAGPVVNGLSLHLARFAEGVQSVSGAGHPTEFLSESMQRIAEFVAAEGDAFPRLECWQHGASHRFALTLRRAPALSQSLAVAASVAHERSHPALKGPNIPLHTQLMHAHGGETLIVSPSSGAVIEGTTTTLVWWEGGQLMCAPRGPGFERVASVTERLVCDIAERRGQLRGDAARTPQELLRHEVWALNALHGIRRVTRINQVALRAETDVARLASFREFLTAAAEPMG